MCIRDRLYIAILFERLAAVYVIQKKAEAAVILLGAAERLRKTIGIPLPTLDQPRHDQMIETVRNLSQEGAFSTAWAKGESMTVEDAIIYVLGKSLSE